MAKKRKKGGTILLIIAVIVIAGAIYSGLTVSEINGVKLKESISVTVASGDGSAAVAAKLKKSGAIKHPLIFRLKSRTGGYDGRFLPGDAVVKNGMSYDDILNLMVSGGRDEKKITVPEGYTVKQIKEKLVSEGIVTAEDFDNAINPDDYDYKFLKDIPDRENRIEGYLYPSTYYIEEGMSAHDIVNMMLKEFDSQFKAEYYDRADALNLTIDEAVTMASIIQRETGDPNERAKVAGVFYNRLRAGMNFQSCATVQYILGTPKSVLSVEDTKIDSPYNTYIHPGFPIGPICNPEQACIEAALYPEKTDAYYFVLGKNGEHIFSKTYEEHMEAQKNND